MERYHYYADNDADNTDFNLPKQNIAEYNCMYDSLSSLKNASNSVWHRLFTFISVPFILIGSPSCPFLFLSSAVLLTYYSLSFSCPWHLLRIFTCNFLKNGCCVIFCPYLWSLALLWQIYFRKVEGNNFFLQRKIAGKNIFWSP